MLRMILIGVGVIVVAFAVIVALRPADFRVARSSTIAAAPSAVFGQVNDFHNWEAWNPWGKIDPAMRSSYTGAASGPGAVYSWWGNNEVGEGRMTITDARAGELVRIKLEFFKPFAATNEAQFVFKSEGDKTALTWTMTGKNNFIGKAMCLVFDMDKMVGGDFEKGLAGIRAIVEAKK